MNRAIPMLVVTSALAAAGASYAQTMAPAPSPAAVSAERFGMQASYHSPGKGVGYSLKTRRVADCLATYPGYDPKIDRITVAPGVMRKCTF